MSNDAPVNNPGPYDMTCPFCHVALVGGPTVYVCPQCKTFARHIPAVELPPQYGILTLDMLSEDCIWLSDALPSSLNDRGEIVLALTIRQIARRYRWLLEALRESDFPQLIPTPPEQTV